MRVRVYVSASAIEKMFEKCNGLGLKGDWIEGDAGETATKQFDDVRAENTLLMAKLSNEGREHGLLKKQIDDMFAANNRLKGEVAALERMIDRITK